VLSLTEEKGKMVAITHAQGIGPTIVNEQNRTSLMSPSVLLESLFCFTQMHDTCLMDESVDSKQRSDELDRNDLIKQRLQMQIRELASPYICPCLLSSKDH
jgi:hypothetical protein